MHCGGGAWKGLQSGECCRTRERLCPGQTRGRTPWSAEAGRPKAAATSVPGTTQADESPGCQEWRTSVHGPRRFLARDHRREGGCCGEERHVCPSLPPWGGGSLCL